MRVYISMERSYCVIIIDSSRKIFMKIIQIAWQSKAAYCDLLNQMKRNKEIAHSLVLYKLLCIDRKKKLIHFMLCWIWKSYMIKKLLKQNLFLHLLQFIFWYILYFVCEKSVEYWLLTKYVPVCIYLECCENAQLWSNLTKLIDQFCGCIFTIEIGQTCRRHWNYR